MKIFIDGNPMFFKAYHIFSQLHPDLPLFAVYGFMKSLVYNINKYKSLDIIVTFDKSKSSYRKRIYPEYKANRDGNFPFDYDDFKYQQGVLEVVLRYCGVDSVVADGYEADDILAYYAVKETEPNVIVTGDKDLLQLIDDNTSVEITYDHTLYTIHNFRRLTGYRDTCEFVLAKAIMGDTSDNIKGCVGLGEKRTKYLLHKHGCDIESISKDEKYGHKIDLDVVSRNIKLVDLKRYVKYAGHHIVRKMKYNDNSATKDISRAMKMFNASGLSTSVLDVFDIDIEDGWDIVL